MKGPARGSSQRPLSPRVQALRHCSWPCSRCSRLWVLGTIPSVPVTKTNMHMVNGTGTNNNMTHEEGSGTLTSGPHKSRGRYPGPEQDCNYWGRPSPHGIQEEVIPTDGWHLDHMASVPGTGHQPPGTMVGGGPGTMDNCQVLHPTPLDSRWSPGHTVGTSLGSPATSSEHTRDDSRGVVTTSSGR